MLFCSSSAEPRHADEEDKAVSHQCPHHMSSVWGLPDRRHHCHGVLTHLYVPPHTHKLFFPAAHLLVLFLFFFSSSLSAPVFCFCLCSFSCLTHWLCLSPRVFLGSKRVAFRIYPRWEEILEAEWCLCDPCSSASSCILTCISQNAASGLCGLSHHKLRGV